MPVETMKDILHWTADFHQQLSKRLQRGAKETKDERAHLLLDYLAEHEKHLSEALRRLEADGISSALNSWYNDYLDQHPLTRLNNGKLSFAEMNSSDILNEIIAINQQVLDLYRGLAARATTSEAKELFQNLLNLEQHEAMQMTQSANRFTDL